MSGSQNYQSPKDFHRHRCKFCEFVWEHHDDKDIRHGDAGDHECQKCGRCNWSLGIYNGPLPPSVIDAHKEETKR